MSSYCSLPLHCSVGLRSAQALRTGIWNRNVVCSPRGQAGLRIIIIAITGIVVRRSGVKTMSSTHTAQSRYAALPPSSRDLPYDQVNALFPRMDNFEDYMFK